MWALTPTGGTTIHSIICRKFKLTCLAPYCNLRMFINMNGNLFFNATKSIVEMPPVKGKTAQPANQWEMSSRSYRNYSLIVWTKSTRTIRVPDAVCTNRDDVVLKWCLHEVFESLSLCWGGWSSILLEMTLGWLKWRVWGQLLINERLLLSPTLGCPISRHFLLPIKTQPNPGTSS